MTSEGTGVARLREALERIATQGCGEVRDGRLVGSDGRPWQHWQEIAREVEV